MKNLGILDIQYNKEKESYGPSKLRIIYQWKPTKKKQRTIT